MRDGGLEAVLLGNRTALLRFMRARGGTQDAEDLLHELWLKLAAAPPAGPIADPLAYLYRMADNLMHDRRRAALRRHRRETAWSDAASALAPDASDAPSTERVLVARDEVARIEVALATLGPRTVQIFRSCRIDGAGQKTIAAEHGISLSAVEKHLQRAYRTIMAARVDDDGAGLPKQRRPDTGNIIDVRR